MNTITIAISDERLVKLQKVAADLNVSIEELLLISLENLLAQRETSTPHTTKNAELDLEIVDKFYALAKQWENEVAGISSTAQMSQNPRAVIISFCRMNCQSRASKSCLLIAINSVNPVSSIASTVRFKPSAAIKSISKNSSPLLPKVP
ncbi:hypothetical protein [Argonema antarcticum]|uniref:hypothetical protein n=1 Tax=Argonema antarcticum TaxID=2942763 RepID=UPI002011273C|nr:hypothetical protein [Argonema antarcticum]MCL1470162.1 hypothetical protein [Argonema antarcticum A004/B2]